MATSTNATDLITMIRPQFALIHGKYSYIEVWSLYLHANQHILTQRSLSCTRPSHVSLCPSPFHQRNYYPRSLDLAEFSPLVAPRSSRTWSWVSDFLFPWVVLFASLTKFQRTDWRGPQISAEGDFCGRHGRRRKWPTSVRHLGFWQSSSPLQTPSLADCRSASGSCSLPHSEVASKSG